jgi:N-acetylglucosaminyl-diphospho-decaprenol L-rhamnosyltransferase
MLDLSIVIVNWNVCDLLRDCLNSVQNTVHNITYEIIVVDSASSDASVDMVKSEFPNVKLLAQNENVGFTRGNNLGLAIATGRHLFLLNPDTVVLDHAVEQMVAYLDQNPTVGIVGAHTLNTDGTHQSTRRRFPTFTSALFESTWLQPYAPQSLLNRFYAVDIADNAIAPVDWVQGSALMARREVYEQIGGLDTNFVMFSEEVDWCKRAKDHGWEVIYHGQAQIIHHGGQSTAQIAAQKHIYFQESKLRYFYKHHGAFQAQLLRLFLMLNYLWEIIIHGIKALVGHKRDLRKQYIHTYWQVLRSGLKVSS